MVTLTITFTGSAASIGMGCVDPSAEEVARMSSFTEKLRWFAVVEGVQLHSVERAPGRTTMAVVNTTPGEPGDVGF